MPKSKVMHIGKRNTEYRYEMNGTVLQMGNNECDPGIEVCNDTKVSDQCFKSYVKSHQSYQHDWTQHQSINQFITRT